MARVGWPHIKVNEAEDKGFRTGVVAGRYKGGGSRGGGGRGGYDRD